MNDTPLTVADLKALLNTLPDDTTLWAWDATEFQHFAVTAITHDKRVNGLNLWIKED